MGPPKTAGAAARRVRLRAMATRPQLLDKNANSVRQMFAGVAPRYDFLNHLLSLSQDKRWRRLSARALGVGPGALVLDLCCGTGDQALAVQRHGARVVASDFCLPMLAIAERKYEALNGGRPAGLAGDSLVLPFGGSIFDGATVSFGLRNVADLDRGLEEIHRVLRPGGTVAFLEFAVPTAAPLRWLYLLYFRRLLPLIGRMISSSDSAYTYLPESVLEFPQRRGFVDRMAAAGFEDSGWRDLSAGIVCLYTGRRGGE